MRNHLNQVNANRQRKTVGATKPASWHQQGVETETVVRNGIVKELAMKDGCRIDELDRLIVKKCWPRHLHHHRYMNNCGYIFDNRRLASDQYNFWHASPEADTDELLDRMAAAHRLLTERRSHKKGKGRKARGRGGRKHTIDGIDPKVESEGEQQSTASIGTPTIQRGTKRIKRE